MSTFIKFLLSNETKYISVISIRNRHFSFVYLKSCKRSNRLLNCLSTPHCKHARAVLHSTAKTSVKALKLTEVEDDKQKKYLKLISPSRWREIILESVPLSFQPYLKLMRLDKPSGTWLLLWPCFWSIGLAAVPGHLPDLSLLFIFGSGALLMRGAGCVVNDMWDRNIDSCVERTKNRPLASGEVSMQNALIFLGGVASLADFILLQLNWHTILLGASSLGLVIIYPYMKRITYWPQVILGLAFNWGAMMGWSAVYGSCEWSIILPLYAACISWTMVYDTIYAHQDKKDDKNIGVKSTALKFGGNTKKWLGVFSTSMITCLLTTGAMSNQTWPYYCAVCATGVHLFKQITSLDINNPSDCWMKFKSNYWIGWILFSGIIAGTLLK